MEVQMLHDLREVGTMDVRGIYFLPERRAETILGARS